MKNLTDYIWDSIQGKDLSEFDLEVNKLLSEAAEAQKEEVLPVINECRKCSNPVKEGESLCGQCI